MFTKPLTRALRNIVIKSFFSYLHDLSHVFKNIETTMIWNFMSKAIRFLQITAKHQDCPFLTVFLDIKTSSQNISITLLQTSLKPHEHRGGYWRKKLPWMILEEQFPVPRYIAASKIGNSVISLLWQLRCCCKPDHNKFSSLSKTTVVAIFPNLCLWRRSLCSSLGGIDIRLFTCILRHSSFLQNFLFNHVKVLKSTNCHFIPQYFKKYLHNYQ